ncbi:putative DD41D transposase [Trichonephila clavipes]|nr:putative DD41D transposase [Trichonephila clavipes]
MLARFALQLLPTTNHETQKDRFGLASHQNDHQARRRFVEGAQNEIAVVPDFHKQILFSDEAHFWLHGYVNKQNCRIWSEANPQVYVETPLHPEKLIVWCALWAGGIIGPYFFKNDEGHNVTVNGDRYRAMITTFFIPELNNRDVQELWFQQDGATGHTGLSSNPGEGLDVCKCIVPSRHGGTLNCHRAASPLVTLVAKGERWDAPSQGVLPQNWGETELNRTVTCMVLNATANDRRISSPLP